MKLLSDSVQEHVASLVERFKANREDAVFTELHSIHRPIVYSLAYRGMGNRHDAEDVTQEVFLRVAGNIDTFRGDCRLAPG